MATVTVKQYEAVTLNKRGKYWNNDRLINSLVALYMHLVKLVFPFLATGFYSTKFAIHLFTIFTTRS